MSSLAAWNSNNIKMLSGRCSVFGSKFLVLHQVGRNEYAAMQLLWAVLSGRVPNAEEHPKGAPFRLCSPTRTSFSALSHNYLKGGVYHLRCHQELDVVRPRTQARRDEDFLWSDFYFIATARSTGCCHGIGAAQSNSLPALAWGFGIAGSQIRRRPTKQHWD